MFVEMQMNELMLVNGGNVADKISAVIKVTAGVVAVVYGPEPMTKVAGIYAIADGVADWKK